MALFGSFNNLISTGLSILGQQPGTLGQFGNIGSQIIRASAPAPGSLVAQQQASAVGPGLAVPMITGVRAVAGSIAAILGRMSAALGIRNMTVRKAMKLYRKLARTIVDPFVIANIMGITVAELGELLVSDAQRTRRRMNPANSSALRRAARRIESFHKLCVRTDRLRAPRRRSAPRRGAVNVRCA